MEELDAKERADQKKRHDRNVAQRETLDEQCMILNGKKASLKAKNLEEEKRELEVWRQDDEAEKKKQQDLLEAAYARGRATKDFNMANTGKATKLAAVERKQDLLLLQYALEKEKAEIHGEWMKKQVRDGGGERGGRGECSIVGFF